MATGINWDEVRKDLDSQEWETVEKDREERQVFLGTVFNLYPSGKYYMPFACGNVEVCKACAEADAGPCDETSTCTPPDDYDEEEEYHCEVCRDSAFLNDLESEAHEHGLFVTSGEGDPCDILAGESKDIPNPDDEIDELC